MAIRIGKIARELNVGVKTITDFLQKKGFEDVSTENPNYKLSDEQENLLIVEFSQDKARKEEAIKKMRPKNKHANNKPEAEPVEAEILKLEKPAEPVIQFKTVGKIQLDESMATESTYVKSVREEKAAKEEVKPAPKVEQKPVQKEEPKPVQKVEQKVEPVVQAKPVEKPKAEPAVKPQPVAKPESKPISVSF
jgi:translation initiation factor IF-2